MGNIEQQIIELAKQGFGRPTIFEKLEGQATDWQIRRVLAEVRASDETLTEEERKRVGYNVRPSNFDVVSSLKPLEVVVPRNRKIVPESRKAKKVIFVSDTHAPFEDQTAIDIACQIIADEQPDILVHLGDLVDFYSISKYEKDPTRRILLQDELEAAARVLGKFDQSVSKSARKIFVPGNHEERLSKYIKHNAPALAGVPHLQLNNLLGLENLGWEYIEHDLELFPEFLIKHGDLVRQNSGYSARGEIDRSWMSGISGHTHRLALYTYTPKLRHLRTQQPAFWVENGCLCTLDPEWMADSPNWQQGFTILHFYDHEIIPEFVHIVFGKAIHRGKLYKG